MTENKLPQKFIKLSGDFINNLKNIYQEDLTSIILYGSAASGEFIDKHSNINLLVVLKDAGLKSLKRSSALVHNSKFRVFKPLFLTEDYIKTSLDIFPIEFLDIQENYVVMSGKDVIKDLSIGLKNLKFQCEQELKAKLLNIKNHYLYVKGEIPLKFLLLKSFTSILHILRNLVRLNGRKPAYLKEDMISQIAEEFKVNPAVFNNILSLKNNRLKLRYAEMEKLLSDFVVEVEKIGAKIALS